MKFITGMMKEGPFTGRWRDDDGTEFREECYRVSIDCERERLQEAIRGVKKIGRKLHQRAMYFEVTGYDGVQFLRIA